MAVDSAVRLSETAFSFHLGASVKAILSRKNKGWTEGPVPPESNLW